MPEWRSKEATAKAPHEPTPARDLLRYYTAGKGHIHNESSSALHDGQTQRTTFVRPSITPTPNTVSISTPCTRSHIAYDVGTKLQRQNGEDPWNQQQK